MHFFLLWYLLLPALRAGRRSNNRGTDERGAVDRPHVAYKTSNTVLFITRNKTLREFCQMTR